MCVCVCVCDFQELYRYLIDDFVFQYCQSLAKRDFMFKTEKLSGQKKGKREFLNDVGTKDFTAKLNDYFEKSVVVPRIKVGQRQTIETLINEEALLFAKYLRNEKKDWLPRIAVVAQRTLGARSLNQYCGQVMKLCYSQYRVFRRNRQRAPAENQNCPFPFFRFGKS